MTTVQAAAALPAENPIQSRLRHVSQRTAPADRPGGL